MSPIDIDALFTPLPPSPLQAVSHPMLTERQIRLWVKRDDLLHPALIGNKYRKSTVYFRQAVAQGITTLVSFGGAYSNHLLALAAMGQQVGMQTVGCVRGEVDLQRSPILAQCAAYGMQLIALTRQAYYPEQQQMSVILQQQLQPFAPYLIVPEGGTSAACVADVSRIVDELAIQQACDVLVCPVGSGGTLAGLAYGLMQRHRLSVTQPKSALSQCRLLGLSAAKGYTALPMQGQQALQQACAADADLQQRLFNVSAWLTVDSSAALNGFGRIKPAQLQQLCQLQQQLQIPLDYVYTGKALLHLWSSMQQQDHWVGQRVVFVHTGGYQTAALPCQN
jgi:1-aminocyclopropane-1-carboxylate deaminase